MPQDAFTGGLEPGGLWKQTDIRILLCYVLASVNAPLSGEDLSEILLGKGLANYFETTDALAVLAANGNIFKDDDGFYSITSKGREIADSLDATLPLSVRDKALEAAVSLLAQARTRRENRVEITQTDHGFKVDCHISGGDMDLMTLSLYVPDEAQAQLVEKHFYSDPAGVYRLLLSALTGDRSFAKSFLENGESGNDPQAF